jgi:hypothetical protein
MYVVLPLSAWMSLKGQRSIVVNCWIGATIVAGFSEFLIAARVNAPWTVRARL